MCLFLLTSEYAVVMCSYSPWWWWIVSSRSWSSEGSSPSPHALHHGSTLLMYCEKRQIYSICIETQVQHHTNAIKTEQAGQLKITIALICFRKSFLHTNNNPEVFYPDGGAYENFYGRTNTVKKRKVRHHLEKERQSDGIYSQNCEQLMDFDLICHLQGSLGHERPHRKRATQQTTVVNN